MGRGRRGGRWPRDGCEWRRVGGHGRGEWGGEGGHGKGRNNKKGREHCPTEAWSMVYSLVCFADSDRRRSPPAAWVALGRGHATPNLFPSCKGHSSSNEQFLLGGPASVAAQPILSPSFFLGDFRGIHVERNFQSITRFIHCLLTDENAHILFAFVCIYRYMWRFDLPLIDMIKYSFLRSENTKVAL